MVRNNNGIVGCVVASKRVLLEMISEGFDEFVSEMFRIPSIEVLTICLALTAAKGAIACSVHWVWLSFTWSSV